MAKIEIEVTDQEKEWIIGYAELQGLSISEAVVRVVMEKLKEGRSLDELFEGFEGFEGECTTEEIDWGNPVGEEVRNASISQFIACFNPNFLICLYPTIGQLLKFLGVQRRV